MVLQRATTNALLATILMCFGTDISALAATFEEGQALYRKKDYPGAVGKFIEVAQENPTNADAVYHAAYASYQGNQKPDAIKLFWYVAKKCSTSKHAFGARNILKKIDPDYVAHSNDASFGVNLPAPKKASRKARIKISDSTEDKRALIEAIVKLTPRRSNRPDVTSEFVAEIKKGLNQFSVPMLKFLQKNNCHIVITPCVVESDFRMEKFRPGGYPEGSSMEDVPALFDSHDIVMGQYSPKRSGGYKEHEGTLGMLRHEIGHAIDRFSGNLSQQDDFKHARVWDYPYRSKDKLAYFIGGRRGDAEAFAELCCFKFGGRTGSEKEKEDVCTMLHRSSARSYAMVERAIEKIEMGE